MVRNLILSAVLATGTGLTLTPVAAEAHPPVVERHGRSGHDHGRVRFEVLYRHGRHWDSYATYRDRDDAQRAAQRLRFRGYDVRVELNRGR